VAGSMPPQVEEFRQLHRSLFAKVLDKAASDPAWKQQLLDDPDAALRAAGFTEPQRIEELRQREVQEAEVTGQAYCGCTAYYTCDWYTY
jgi:hypothetical protein